MKQKTTYTLLAQQNRVSVCVKTSLSGNFDKLIYEICFHIENQYRNSSRIKQRVIQVLKVLRKTTLYKMVRVSNLFYCDCDSQKLILFSVVAFSDKVYFSGVAVQRSKSVFPEHSGKCITHKA